MSRYQDMVREFHQVIKCEYGWGQKKLRINLIKEKAKEVHDATQAENPIELLDSLCGLLYVVYGAADLLGLELRRCEEAAAYMGIVKWKTGFELLKEELPQLEEAVRRACDAIQEEDKRKTSQYLSGLVFGCWRSAAHSLEMDLEPFFEEVHRANMLKLTGPRMADGKVLKLDGWQSPRIEAMYAKRKGMPVPEDTP